MQQTRTLLPPAPPLAIGAALLIWGWQNEFLLFALPMAVILESARLVSWRWPISDREFNLIADVSGVIFFLVVVYIFFTVRSQGIYTILSILPFVFFLVMLTQVYSETGNLKLSVLFISLRKLEGRKSPGLDRTVDISLPYIMACLVSASAGNLRTIWFYVLSCCLLAYLLWRNRSPRYGPSTWAVIFAAAVAIGFGTQEGIRDMQRAIEQSLMSVFDQFMWRYRDPNRVTTAIGTIGRLKFSDRVLVRVKPQRPFTEPVYLHEATYDSYNYGVWSTRNPAFTLIDPDSGGESWTLNNLDDDNRMAIATYMVKETGVVPVPHGTSHIAGTGIIEINQNDYGTVNMEMREGWVSYNAIYTEKNLPAWEPTAEDLEVNENYRADFERLARELALYGKPETEVVRTVYEHFTRNFLYTLDRRQRYPRGRYLADFLFENREGHCEFFATSTVLLLRTVGIPARYAVGYYIHEYSNLERLYVGRSRHAHSWALVYVNGRWQVLDTTPSTWAPYEEANASGLQGLFDFTAWLRYKLSRWRTKDELDDEEEDTLDLAWLLIPLVLILTWRLLIKERIQKASKGGALQHGPLLCGLDSAFFVLTGKLEQLGHRRREGETMSAWLRRIDHGYSVNKLLQALQLHYRYRFDPAGSTTETRQQLRGLVDELLGEMTRHGS